MFMNENMHNAHVFIARLATCNIEINAIGDNKEYSKVFIQTPEPQAP